MLFKRKFLIFIFLLVFTILTYQSIKGKSRISDFPAYPVKILAQGTSVIIKSVKNFFNTYVLIVGKEKENQKLIDRLNRFQQEKNQYMETMQENERLRKLLKLKSKRTDYVTAAEVFARDPTNWFQMLWINKGKDDGVSKDMIAVTPMGPVGRIQSIFNDRASIILLTDVNSSIAVRIQSSRIEGILEGRGNTRCYLKYISQEADVNVGDRVITSGLDGIYPKGLFVGNVVSAEKRPGEFFQQIEIAPAQDLNTVEEVAILKR